MATAEAPRPTTGATDSNELAGFGYKQELDRSLGRRRLETNDGPGEHHGRDGPVNIRTVPPEDPCGGAILQAAAKAGLPTSRFNEGHTVSNGAGWFQINSAADNTRMSSSHAYLHPIIGKRANLEIRTHCWASRVVLDGIRATGVST